MKYTVVWLPFAENSLTTLYLSSPDKQEITEASDRLDKALANDPETKGKPFGRFWVREDAPLAALYQVIPDDRMVRVLSVKRS